MDVSCGGKGSDGEGGLLSFRAYVRLSEASYSIKLYDTIQVN